MISLRRFLFVWIPLRWMLKLPTSLFGCLLIQVKFLVNPIILIILVLWFSWIGVKSFGKVISTFFRSFLLLAIFSLKCLPIDEVFLASKLEFSFWMSGLQKEEGNFWSLIYFLSLCCLPNGILFPFSLVRR